MILYASIHNINNEHVNIHTIFYRPINTVNMKTKAEHYPLNNAPLFYVQFQYFYDTIRLVHTTLYWNHTNNMEITNILRQE